MPLLDTYVAELERILGDRLVGIIQYGAMCFPPSPVSDFDAHVFVSDPFTDDDRTAIEAMLGQLPVARDEMDVWYVTLDEARSREQPQTQLRPGYRDDAWALHRAHWHAGRFVLVRGPDPREIVPQPTWDEIDASLQAELSGIAKHVTESPAYSVLNLCRVLYSYETHDVVTGKYQSAVWAHAVVDVDHHPVIRSAIDAYATKTYAMDDDVRPFFEDMSARITRARELG